MKKIQIDRVWCKIALLVVFSAFYIAAIPFPEKSRQFPQLIAIVSLIMTVMALVLDFTRKKAVQGEISGVDDTELQVLDDRTRRERRKRYYQAWAIILVSTGIGFLGGFLFSALCLFAGFAVFSGSREKLVRNTIVAVATTIVVYFIFGTIMGVPMLSGILW
jgi:hypothetical protein